MGKPRPYGRVTIVNLSEDAIREIEFDWHAGNALSGEPNLIEQMIPGREVVRGRELPLGSDPVMFTAAVGSADARHLTHDRPDALHSFPRHCS